MKTLIKTGIGMLVAALVFIALTAGFMRAHAATPIGTESRQIESDIVNIVMTGPVDLELRQSATPSLMLKGELSMLPRITTKIEGKTLYLGTRGIIVTIRQPLVVELALPNLEKLHMQGSGDARIKNFNGKRLDVTMRGSGDFHFEGDFQQIASTNYGSGDSTWSLLNNEQIDLELFGSGDAIVRGQTNSLNSKLMGSGDLDATNLKAAQALVTGGGSGDLKVFASQEVKVRLTGSGDATIYGNPSKKSVDRTGSGEIRWQ